MQIRIEQLDKWYGAFHALKEMNLEIPSGQITALLGPSGSGKTTLLRMIAGIEANDGKGKVWFGNEEVTHLAAAQRKVGFVFQHYALFQHLSVLDNVAFGLKIRPRHERPSDSQINQRALELLNLVQLGGLEKRYPRQLSGGQRQRVALARALAVEPRVLLLDEPFGALDAQVRKELRRWLRSLHHDVPLTTLFVTHDQEEALEIADRVVILHQGRIEQIGNPQEVYDHPANPFVYQFLGNVNRIAHPTPQNLSNEIDSPGEVTYVRPHDIDLYRTPVDNDALPLIADAVTRVGPVARIYLQRIESSDIIEVEMSRVMADSLNLQPKQTVYATLRRSRVFTEEYSI